jgi:hypothetical protein
VTPNALQKYIGVSGEHTASIFRVEETKEETGKKQTSKSSLFYAILITANIFDPLLLISLRQKNQM